MAKQLNVDMTFNADTSKAKQSIQELQNAIQKLGYGTAPKNGLVDPAAFEKASSAARELAYHLNHAYNTKTGNLDLSRLNSSLKAANTDLPKLTSSFKNAGATGQQAFVSLAKAIAQADQPTLTLNSHLSTMWTTLKNVARFQLSSSIMHALVGGVQQAYGYAQDLNESLNNIRIVTGQNVDQMARFAEEANKTARSLSSSTLDYTNASLIYYQQGLDDAAVKERTDVTIKMANVARESAETVSKQMTAIWNNFDDGSKSLEYYADVITALGAATASSSSEISQGLEKFAAVADTVGLSYENATAALATITATTRQSADTVGTGLRTLFSRLQGLSLGETLEDGVDLNKYSKALETVGVHALDASGNLRRMDDVLEDLGERWGQLSNAQQTALAQTVGGVRQYTTLIALMDNWDFMKQNQQVAANAEGTLQGQADIYAESWEAARKRVQAAAQAIYSDLINDKFFIKITNLFETALTGLDTFIDHFGGLKSILIATLSFVLSMTANKIGPALQKMVQNIQVLTGGAKDVYSGFQKNFQKVVRNEIETGNYNNAQAAELTGTSNLLLMRTKLNAKIEELSETEKMQAELAIQGLQLQADNVVKLGAKVDELKQKEEEAKEAEQKAIDERKRSYGDLQRARAALNQTKAQIDTQPAKALLANTNIDFSKLDTDISTVAGTLSQKLKTALTGTSQEAQKLGGDFSQMFRSIATGVNSTNLKEKQNELRYLQESFKDLFKTTDLNATQLNKAFQQAFNAKTPEEFAATVKGLSKMLTNAEIPADKLGTALKNLGINPESVDRYTAAWKKYQAALKAAEDKTNQTKEAIDAVTAAETEFKAAQEGLNKSVDDFNPQHIVDGTQTIVALAAGIGQVVTLLNVFKSIWETLNNEDATFGEKAVAIISALSTTLFTAIGLMNNFKTIKEGIYAGAAKRILAETGETGAITSEAIAAKAATLATEGFGKALGKVLVPILPFIAALGVLVGVIIAVSKALKDAENQKPEKVFERATAAANSARDAFEDCKTKAEELKSAFDNYNTIVDKLNNCQKGTQEWTNALVEANDQVLALLEKYPELAKYVERDENGLLTFSRNGGQEAAQAAMDRETQIASRRYSMAKLQALDAEAIAKTSGVHGYNASSYTNFSTNTSGRAHRKTEADQRVAELRQSKDEIDSAVIGFINEYGKISTADYAKLSSYLYEHTGIVGDALDSLTQSIIKHSTEYNDLTDELSDIDIQKKLYHEQLGQSYADEEGVNQFYQRAGVNEAIGMALETAADNWRKEHSEEEFKNKDAVKTWAKDFMGQDNIKDVEIDDDGAISYKFLSASGEWEEAGTTAARILSDTASQFAEESINIGNIIAETTAKINASQPEYQDLINSVSDPNQQQQLASVLDTIDWSDPITALADAQALLNELGIKADPDKLEAYANAMSKVNLTAENQLDNSDQKFQDFETAKTQLDVANDLGNSKKIVQATQKYLDAKKAYEEAQIAERKSMVSSLGGDVEQFNKYTVAVKDLAKATKEGENGFKGLAKSVANNDVEAAELAKDFSRFDLAVESASKNMEQWQAAFNDGTPYEYAKALEEVRDTYGNLLDLDGSTLSEEFLTSADNLGLMEAALDGNEEAYQQLLDLAHEDLLSGIRESLIQNGGDLEGFNSALDTVRASMEQMGWDALDAGASIEDALANLPDGVKLDNQEFLDSLTEMVTAAGLTAEQATDLLSSMGIDAQVETVQPKEEVVKTSNQYWEPATYITQTTDTGGEDSPGKWTSLQRVKRGRWVNVPGEQITTTPGAAAIKVTSAHKSAGGEIKFNHTAGGASRAATNRKPTTGSGGSSSSKSSTPKSVSARYHDTLNRREKTKNAFDKAQNEKEGLWGQARIDKWKEAQKALEDYIKAQQDLLKDTERWLKTDKKALQDALSKINVTITPQFDENGTITNYEAILEQINNLYQKYNGNEDMTALIEAAQKALEQYDKTNDLWIDRKKELDDLNKQLDKLRKEEQIEQKERERYHRIERELAENDRKLEEERRKRERAYGEERLAYLREEQQLLQERQKLYEQYLAEIEKDRKYIDQDRNDLIEAFTTLGLNVEFDENGEIANIEELFDKVDKAWRSGDNSMFGTDPEEAEKRWGKFTKAIERYEGTLNSLHEIEQKLAEVTDELLDNILELVTTQVELRIEISDRDLKRIEYALKYIEDDVYKTAEALALLGRQGDVAMNKIAAYEQGIADILNISLEEFQTLSDNDLQTLLSNLDANAITQVEEYCDALREQKTELMELQKTIVDKVLSAYDELNEKVDEAYDRFSQFSDLLSSYNEIVELSAGVFGPLTDQIQDFIRATNISNAQNQTTAARERLAAAQADLAAYSGDNEEILKRLQEAVRSANEAFLSSIQETLQALQEAYEDAFNDIFDNLDKWVDNAEKAYGRQKELNEEYLTDYEKTYQLNKLSRDLDKTLNNTNSAKGRARLLELQKEINDGMADANRLSAYDVEFLQKKLALEQARLDLENARNAKSYMQLQRGADGQWGYVYTANEEAVEQAEQAYEDRQHDIYELQKRQEAALTDQLHSLAQSRAQAMRDLESNRKDMTEEEYQAERAALENHFQERARYMFEQMGNLFDNNNWADQLYNMGLALGISESTLSSIAEHDDLGEAMALFLNHFGDAQAQSDEEYAQYISAVKNFLSSNDVTVETLQAAIENIGFGSLENVDSVIAASADLSTTFAHSMDVANEELNKLQQAIDSVTDSLDPFIDRLYSVMTILEGGAPINLSDIDLTPSDKTTPSPMPIGLLNPGYPITPTPISNPSSIDLGQILQTLPYINGDSMSSVGENFLRSVMPRLPDFLTSMLEQNVQIAASFPSVVNHLEIEEAFNNLINKATQYANRKNMRSITFGDSYNY